MWHNVLGPLQSSSAGTTFYPCLCPPALVSVLYESEKHNVLTEAGYSSVLDAV